MIKKILFASQNPGKFAEAKDLAAFYGFELIAPKDVELESLEVEEHGNSYVENAKLKALAFFEASNMPVIADDAGLEIESLGGKPGLHSARYGGDVSFEEKIKLLLAELDKVEKREASFVCTMCFLSSNFDLTVEASLKGKIASAASGDGGFGYDSIFIPEGHDNTLAELKKTGEFETHRIKALNDLFAKLLVFLN